MRDRDHAETRWLTVKQAWNRRSRNWKAIVDVSGVFAPRRGRRLTASHLAGTMIAGASLRPSSRAEQIMAMPAPHRRWTRSEVKALIDVNPGPTPRYALVDGE